MSGNNYVTVFKTTVSRGRKRGRRWDVLGIDIYVAVVSKMLLLKAELYEINCMI